MNFDFLPFVHTSAGVWLTAVVMAVVAIGLLIYFRRKRYFARGG
jgi:LPXTG-motif cell wall-anchored protein